MSSSCHHCESAVKSESSEYLELRCFLSFLVALFVWGVMSRDSLSPLYQMIPTFLSLSYCGWPILKKGFLSFQRLSLNMFSLISVGLLASFFLSVFGGGGLYYEGTATLVFFVLLGQWIENKISIQSQAAIEKLLSLTPALARKIESSQTEKLVPISELQIGDLLKVVPGTQIPLDGIVTEGSTSVDESLLSGEPIPVEKKAGDWVWAGTLNQNGSIVFQVQKKAQDTQLAQIIKFVEKLQKEKAPIQRQADRASAFFTPLVFVLAALTWLGWGVFGSETGWIQGGIQAVSVLMIACPCALGLATPLALWAGTSLLAKKGILVRSLGAIESFEKMKVLIFDKTGTLTLGKPTLTNWVSIASDFSKKDVLQMAASLEAMSEHPLANAFIQKAKLEKLDLLEVKSFQSQTGKGLQGSVLGKVALLGNLQFLKENKVLGIEMLFDSDDEMETRIGLAIDGQAAAYFSVRDEIRSDSMEVVRQLKEQGLDLILASGDQKKVVQAMAQKLEISKWEGELSPVAKAELIQSYQAKNEKVIFVGDGMNDAPALSQADIGVAMGSGADIAKESAAITLIQGDLKAIAAVKKGSGEMMKVIRQNLFWAFSYNLLGIPLATGLFMPLWQLKLTPLFASVSMTVSSLLVVGNSMRLFYLNYRDAR